MIFPEELIQALTKAERVVALTGAGASKESGIPTFREAQTGLWAQYDPMELATPQAFQRNPALVWDWYRWRRELIGGAQPNAGHYALVEIERRLPEFTLITQNVDGLHAQAGSQTVIELHGNIHRSKCFDEDRILEAWDQDGDGLPRCPACGGLARPDVVWFGENLPPGVIEQSLDLAANADVFLSIGTSGMVQPAASLPRYALENGGLVVEINPDKTPLTPMVDVFLQGAAGEILPELVQAVWNRQKGI